MKTALIILLTAICASALTFTITKKCILNNTQIHAGPYTSGKSFYLTNAHAYPAKQAVADIDSFQRYVDSVSSIYLRAMHDSTCKPSLSSIPHGFFDGVIGYTINSFDLVHALGVYYDRGGDSIMSTYQSVRVYLGYSADSGKFKMFITPVSYQNASCQCAGRDLLLYILPDGGVQVDTSQNPDVNKDVVLDLISPCPTICDTYSPLIDTICNWRNIKCCK